MSVPAFTTAAPALRPPRPLPLLSRVLRRRAPRTRMSASPGTPFSALFAPPASDAVLTPSGKRASLVAYVAANTAQAQPVLVGWLRHYGCTLCKKQTADWRALAPRLRACGDVALALVGNGSPDQARDFVRETQWQGDMFTDPARGTYAALRFRKGLASTFTGDALRKVVASLGEGNRQTWRRLPTDAFQQGGAVLVAKDGTVSLFHTDMFAGDHVPVDQLYKEVCDACKSATAA